MMEFQDQLRLQSYLDGELPEAEARELANWLAKDPDAVALMTELRQTRQALSGFEEDIRLPESGDFYWSKIRREIERHQTPAPEVTTTVSWLARLRRFLMPATGLAVIALLALVVSRETGSVPTEASVETSLADSGALVYHDFSAGATFVWLSYPADNEKNAEDDDGLFD